MSTALVVETREIDPVDDLLPYADPDRPLAWLRRGDGIVAIGAESVTELRVSAGAAASRTSVLAHAWRELASRADVDDPLHLPGTGLVGFGALVFDEGSAQDSVVIVPRAVIGRHRGRSWITRIRDADAADPVSESRTEALLYGDRGHGDGGRADGGRGYGEHWSGTLGPGAQSPQGYQDSVRTAVEEITAREYGKVVLARDLVGTVPSGSDLRRLVRALSTGYPDTWAFAVDGLIGASPETLVTSHGGTVTARVLAGTTARGADADADARASAALASSTKDLDEHQYAVQSVLTSLRPHTRTLAASEQPFTLKLPNLFHLATDVEGELTDGQSSLDLVGALHPTAAVAGAPTDAAVAAIRRLEPFDRGRYAGPVGWVDGDGDGEWAIALRCAQFGDPLGADEGLIPITAYAGAGIVAGSDPEAELLETRVKFRPIVDAMA
ncbi:menaquinone-specific isochorismate synthase [Microbacterium resistens]|uniref:isochorismate synthase n=1 Tax=Microbacterium resistens TaxID=156977 RepID=A0ABU1SAP3_9MICO|nr:chorismate-binding protein [Microbacterium resistens]MDR6866684.1 menaquinone-specific isochorismate synthase [Microbacterium resistens]